MTKAGAVNSAGQTLINPQPVLATLPSRRTINNNPPPFLSDGEVIAIANKAREILNTEGAFSIPEKIGESYCYLNGNLRSVDERERAFTLNKLSGLNAAVENQMKSVLKDVAVLDWTSDKLAPYVDKVEEKICNQDLSETPSLETVTKHRVTHLAFKYLLQQRKVVFEFSTVDKGEGLKQTGPEAVNNWLTRKKVTLAEFSSRWLDLKILNQAAKIRDQAPADELGSKEDRLDPTNSVFFEEVPPQGSSVMAEPAQIESQEVIKEEPVKEVVVSKSIEGIPPQGSSVMAEPAQIESQEVIKEEPVKEVVVSKSIKEVESPLKERVKPTKNVSSQTDLTGDVIVAERRKFVLALAFAVAAIGLAVLNFYRDKNPALKF